MDAHPALQLKEEIMDLDFPGLDADSRKKRRNRTTQSCLNCHTSKRKCDRKRPCSRCIQLGLTGLCIYETSDPNERDDPNLPEVERLRGRVAELESLVRELRGKPHPRWAEQLREVDCPSKPTRFPKLSPNGVHRHNPDYDSADGVVSPTSPIKTDFQEGSRPQLYRLSASPPSTATYRQFPPNGQADATSYFDDANRRDYRANGHGPGLYSPVSPSVSSGYNGSHFSDTSSGYSPRSPSATSFQYSNASSHTPVSAHDGSCGGYNDNDRLSVHGHPSCACLINPAVAHTYIALTHQLQNTANIIRQLPEHDGQSQCGLLRRIVNLNSIMQSSGNPPAEKIRSSYETTTVASTIPAAATPADYAIPSQQGWHHMATGGYNSRYTVPGHAENGYTKPLTYHVGA